MAADGPDAAELALLITAAVKAAVAAKAPRRTVAAVAAAVAGVLGRRPAAATQSPAAAGLTRPRSTGAERSGGGVVSPETLVATLREARSAARRRKRLRRRARVRAACTAAEPLSDGTGALAAAAPLSPSAPRGSKRPLGSPTGAAPMEAEGEPPFPAHSPPMLSLPPPVEEVAFATPSPDRRLLRALGISGSTATSVDSDADAAPSAASATAAPQDAEMPPPPLPGRGSSRSRGPGRGGRGASSGR